MSNRILTTIFLLVLVTRIAGTAAPSISFASALDAQPTVACACI